MSDYLDSRWPPPLSFLSVRGGRYGMGAAIVTAPRLQGRSRDPDVIGAAAASVLRGQPTARAGHAAGLALPERKGGRKSSRADAPHGPQHDASRTGVSARQRGTCHQILIKVVSSVTRGPLT
jgi:hypothetical protein